MASSLENTIDKIDKYNTLKNHVKNCTTQQLALLIALLQYRGKTEKEIASFVSSKKCENFLAKHNESIIDFSKGV